MKGLFNEFKQEGSDYLQARKELIKLQALQKGAEIGAVTVGFILLLIFSVFFLIFCGIGASILIGEVLGSLWGGFLITGGIFLFAILVVIVCIRKGTFENIIIRGSRKMIRNRQQLEEEINALKTGVGQREKDLRDKVMDPFTYIGRVSLLRKLFRFFGK